MPTHILTQSSKKNTCNSSNSRCRKTYWCWNYNSSSRSSYETRQPLGRTKSREVWIRKYWIDWAITIRPIRLVRCRALVIYRRISHLIWMEKYLMRKWGWRSEGARMVLLWRWRPRMVVSRIRLLIKRNSSMMCLNLLKNNSSNRLCFCKKSRGWKACSLKRTNRSFKRVPNRSKNKEEAQRPESSSHRPLKEAAMGYTKEAISPITSNQGELMMSGRRGPK